MTSAITPWPWSVDPNDATQVNGADGFGVGSTNGPHLHVEHDSDKGHWATTPGAALERSEAEEEANARLFAAAPVYAEAFERLCAIALDHGMGEVPDVTVGKVAKAIAREYSTRDSVVKARSK